MTTKTAVELQKIAGQGMFACGSNRLLYDAGRTDMAAELEERVRAAEQKVAPLNALEKQVRDLIQERDRAFRHLEESKAEVERLRKTPTGLYAAVAKCTTLKSFEIPMTQKELGRFLQEERTKYTKFTGVRRTFAALPAETQAAWFKTAEALGQKLGLVFRKDKAEEVFEIAMAAAAKNAPMAMTHALPRQTVEIAVRAAIAEFLK
jgi:hypothetical protein